MRLTHTGMRIMLMPLLQRDWGPGSPQRRFEAARAEVDEMLFAEIRRRRVSGERGDDVLSLLLDARGEDGSEPTEGELRDHLITLLIAGHETTATQLSWTLERLVRHPEVLARARAEALEGGHEYLDAVVKEGQRVRPVLTYVMRTLKAPLEVGGHEVPAGATIGTSITLMHRRADLYDEPLRLPARALPGGQARDLRLDPVRRRRAALPRRAVRHLRDAARAERDPHAARAGRAGPAPRAATPARHHVRPGARRRGWSFSRCRASRSGPRTSR